MSVYELIRRLPGIEQVRATSRALAMLDAVLSPDYRFHGFDASSPTEETASMRSGTGDGYSIVFSAAGAVAMGLDHESPMSPFRPEVPDAYPELFIGLPDSLAPGLEQPFFKDRGTRLVTVCFWRTRQDPSWQCGPIEHAEKDGADWLFDLLADGRPEAYLRFAETYLEASPDLEAIRHVYAQRPLTDRIVTALNPDIGLADLSGDIAEIGYPRH